jgi:hypothetical protein
MSLQYLSGYEANVYPINVDPAQVFEVVQIIRELNLKLTASATTTEPQTVRSMLSSIEDDRSVFDKTSLVGPLTLNGTVKIGNAIGVYEEKT